MPDPQQHPHLTLLRGGKVALESYLGLPLAEKLAILHPLPEGEKARLLTDDPKSRDDHR